MIESESISPEEKEKLEFLLRTKKWNPYCIRHSAIDADAAYIPDHALKKKVRWTMNSKQAVRYVKRRMNDELTSKILEHDGIKPSPPSPILSNRTCGRCGYVNKLESKYCEKVGCNYPLTYEAFEDIKTAEQAKFQELVDKSNLERDNTIQALQQELKSKTQEMQSLSELCKHIWSFRPNRTVR